ncbi:MAG: hypothetical protein QXZ14_10670 [Candidatus Jordarchaeales archaeon]
MVLLGLRWLSEFLGNRFVLLGLLLRLVLSVLFAHDFDVNFFLSVARAYYHDGALMFFVEWAYPVVYFLILLFSYFPADLISDTFLFFGQPFSLSEKFFLKLPFNLADLGVAYMIFRVLREDGREKYALPLSLAYWLNPLSIFVSAVHGHFESVSVFFAVLSFYHLWKENYVLGGLELALSFGAKYQGIILFPAAILFMWGEWKKALKFAVSFIIFASLTLLPLGLFFYEPNFHLFFFSPSLERALSPLTKFAAGLEMVMNPNMTYYSFLVRYGFTLIPHMASAISVSVFALVFCCIYYFAYFKGVFRLKYDSRRTLLTAYFSAAYMAAFLSIGKMSPHFALWALPFLLMLYSDYAIEKILLLLFNFIPLCDYFLVSSIFYYINGGYWNYATSSTFIPAVGLIFSFVCLAILVNFLFEENVVPFKRQILLAAEMMPDRRLALPLIMAALIVVVSLPLNVNGVFWSQYPVLPAYPLEELTYPVAPRLIITFLVPCMLLPAFLLTATKPILLGRRSQVKYLSLRVKIALITVSLALASALASWIVSETLPFVSSRISHTLMFTPSPSSLNPLCVNGGVLVSVLLLVSFFAALLLLLDNVDKCSELKT